MIINRYSLLYILSCFVAALVQARQLKPEWGEQTIITRYTPRLQRIVKGQPDELITVGLKWTSNALNLPDTYVATRYDSNLQHVLEKELFSTRYRNDFHSIYNFKGNVFLFTRQFNRKEKITSFYYAQIDPATLEKIDSNTIGRYKAVSRGWQPEITIKFSPDTSHILFFTEALYKGYVDPVKFTISVHDHRMNKIWDREITLPYTNKYFVIQGFDISNEGEVYIMGKHYDKGVVRERVRDNGTPVPSYTYKILIAGKDKDQPGEHAIYLQHRFVHSMALQFDADGNMNLLGLYMNKNYGNITGHFMALLDKNSKQTAIQKLDTFPAHDLLELLGKDYCASTNPKDPGLDDRFKVMGTNKRNDGSIDLITEYNYRYEEREGSMLDSNRTNSTHTVYVANDIVVINYKKDRPIMYTRIPKWQWERYDTYISFKWMNHGDQLVIFYLDSESNVKKDLSKRPDATFISGSVFVVAVVDDKGGLQRQVAYSHKDFELMTTLNACTVVDTDVFALYAERGRLFGKSKFQFGRLKL